MADYTDYQIISGHPKTLAEEVTTALAANWVCTGNVTPDPLNNKIFHQAMVKLADAVSLITEAGAGITSGVGTVYESSVRKIGGIYTVQIIIDLTGLASSTTDLDIIGVGLNVAHIGQITAAQCGTIIGGTMTCLEVPAGGADDIDLYTADEGTGVFDGGVAALTETALVTADGAWTLGLAKAFSAVPADGDYLYLTGGEAGTAATYTAGKFLIELKGYTAA